MLRQRMYTRMYRGVEAPASLRWHRESYPMLIAAAERRGGGRALDLGCGAGVHAVKLAQLGYAVVGVDFVPDALALARRSAAAAGVQLELVESDVLAYGGAGFDLVLDSGCLHSLSPRRVQEYRRRLDTWLAPGGDFVLVHFNKRNAFDWRPAGPRRARKSELVELFSPLRLEGYDETVFDLSFPIGRSVAGVYWFRGS